MCGKSWRKTRSSTAGAVPPRTPEIWSGFGESNVRLSDESRYESPLNPCAAPFRQFFHFVLGRHRGVAGRRHRQRPVSRAALNSPLRSFVHQETVNQTRSETVAAAHAIKDFQILARDRLIKLTVRTSLQNYFRELKEMPLMST